MIFKRQNAGLEEAILLVQKAIDIALAFKNDPDYLPDQKDMELLRLLEQRLGDASDTVHYLHGFLAPRLLVKS
jgi:hypothetical protein